MKIKAMPMRLLHGGDYNPEQWLELPEILDKDIEYFKKAHINEASIGIFSWAMLEPEEGLYHFDWLDKVVERLYTAGIQIMLATPSGARPKWLADRYPEVLRVAADGSRNFFGGRHNHCYSSPVYREFVRRINTELAKRYGSHPGVIAWHISNEYGGACYCERCQTRFREWLEERYSSIEHLNKAWATTFWSHCYQSFEQIEAPSPRGESMLHALNLDWKRFVTEMTVDFARAEIAAVRAAGSALPATVNMMYDYGGLNYHKFADIIDFVSWDAYPLWGSRRPARIAADVAMQHDIMRSILHKPFYLMESCPSATNWQPVSRLKAPGLLHAASLQAIAHGSDSVQYFQLRQSRGASEKFHGAVIDHYGGSDTRVFREVCELGASLEALNAVSGAQTRAAVAVIYDWESRWALEDAQGPRNQGLSYTGSVLKPYRALRRLGLDVDVIDSEQDFSAYRLLAVPLLYMFRAGVAERLRGFVAEGGTLVLGYFSGVVDETDLCYLGETPHGLTELLGWRFAELDALYDGESNEARVLGADAQAAVMNRDLESDKEGAAAQGGRREEAGKTASMADTAIPVWRKSSYRCEQLCQLVENRDAEVLAVYGQDFYQGSPALLKKAFGKGRSYSYCADFEDALFEDLLYAAVREAGLEAEELAVACPEFRDEPQTEVGSGGETDRRLERQAEVWTDSQLRSDKRVDSRLLPEGVFLNRRYQADRVYLFVQNFSGEDFLPSFEAQGWRCCFAERGADGSAPLKNFETRVYVREQ